MMLKVTSRNSVSIYGLLLNRVGNPPLPLPLPLPYFDASTSPLESFFDSPQLAVSRTSESIAHQNTPALQATCILVLNKVSS